jgi:hypothetical protein
MKKIKIVRSGNAEEFTKVVNDFCCNHNVTDIKLQTFEMVTEYNKNGVPTKSTVLDTAMIIYEE